ncbi:MAG: DUF5668 domain-containing protein [Anaerolineales bacterium]|jgi:hypothetical protein
MSEDRRMPNLFWPVLLIGVGVLLLLSNFDIIEGISFFHLWRLWPLILIALGVHVMFGHEHAWISNLLSLILVAAAIAFLVYAPSLGFSTPGDELITEQFSAPLDGAASANFKFNLDRGKLTIYPLKDTNKLVQVDVTRAEDSDEFHFQVSGTTNKSVDIDLDHMNIDFIFGGWIESKRVTVDVGINPDIPIDLDIDTGASGAVLDLVAFELESLEAYTGSGTIDLQAPSGDYPIVLDAGSGSLTIELTPNSDVDLEASVGSGRITLTLADENSGYVELDSGSGTITVNVPEEIGVEVSGSTGSGGVRLPSDFIRTEGEDVPGPSDSGTWISPGFDSAANILYIDFSVGSGSFRLEEN